MLRRRILLTILDERDGVGFELHEIDGDGRGIDLNEVTWFGKLAKSSAGVTEADKLR